LLFAGSVGRVDLVGGDWEKLLDSVRTLVDRFGRDAVVYPGHGRRRRWAESSTRTHSSAELRVAAE